MLPLPLLAEHLYALVLVWGWALLVGTPLARLGRWRLGIGGAAMVGVAFWAAALHCLPFAGGLYVAAGLVALSWCWLLCCTQRRRALCSPRDSSTWLLTLGCVSFATLPFFNYVPPGMDASMHTTAARLIAARAGLPSTYAPFVPDVHLPAVNLGLPALAAPAIRCSCSPAAAMLAAEQLTYSCALLALWLLLRLVCRRNAAAILALFGIWGGRVLQESCTWGGFPTVMSLALGLLATRQMIGLANRPNLRRALVLGLVLGAMPLVHGISAAVWLYVAAPVGGMTAILTCRRRRAFLVSLSAAGGVAVGLMLAYLEIGRPPMTSASRAWIRECQAEWTPTGTGWEVLLGAVKNYKSLGGSIAVVPGFLACAVLLWRRRVAAFAVAGGAGLLLLVLMINSRYWILPGSPLLYPDRMAMWVAPLAALALALAWRSLPQSRRLSHGLAIVLLGASVSSNLRSFQRFTCRPVVSRGEWEALCWAGRYLDPATAFVVARYHTGGAYLPSLAGVACSGWHYHIFCEEEVRQALDRRQPTHAFEVLPREKYRHEGRVLFQNGTVRIVELPREPDRLTRSIQEPAR